MAKESQEIEVEVVEIDGIPTGRPTRPEPPERGPQTKARAWHQWQGRIRQPPSFWWLIWIPLGLIALSLALTIGLALALIYLVYRAIRRCLRALLP